MSSRNGVAGHVEGATWIGAGQNRSLFAILPRRGRRDRLVRHQVHGCGVEFVEVLPDQQMHLSAIIPFAMPSWNEVENAQQRMNAAHEALRAYLKRPSSQPQDIKLYGRLADELRLTVNEYMDLIIEFLMQRPSS